MSAHKEATEEQVAAPKDYRGAPNEAQGGGCECSGFEQRRGAQDGLESDAQGRCSDGSARWEVAAFRATGMHAAQQAKIDDDSIHVRSSARERFPRPHQRRKHMTIEQALSAVFGARLLLFAVFGLRVRCAPIFCPRCGEGAPQLLVSST